MQSVAVGWQVYDLTKRPLDLGLVGLAQFLPGVLLFLVAGHAADRFNRKRLAHHLLHRIRILFGAAPRGILARSSRSRFDLRDLGFTRHRALLQLSHQPRDSSAACAAGRFPQRRRVERHSFPDRNNSWTSSRRFDVRRISRTLRGLRDIRDRRDFRRVLHGPHSRASQAAPARTGEHADGSRGPSLYLASESCARLDLSGSFRSASRRSRRSASGLCPRNSARQALGDSDFFAAPRASARAQWRYCLRIARCAAESE